MNHTPHGTEEREVFLPEQAIGDPGDEHRFGEGAIAQGMREAMARHAQNTRPTAVGMAPTQAEMAAAIREYAGAEQAKDEFRASDKSGLDYTAAFRTAWGALHTRCENAESALIALAARLPKGRD